MNMCLFTYINDVFTLVARKVTSIFRGNEIMSRSHLLSYISSCLREQGSEVISESDLFAYAAIEETIEKFPEAGEEALQAAAIIIFLHEPNIDDVGKCFGDKTSAILKLFNMKGNTKRILIQGQAARTAATSHDFNAVVAALAILAGEAAIASKANEMKIPWEDETKSLREVISTSITVAKGEIKKALKKISDKIPEINHKQETKDPKESSYMLSVSIDIAGSTEAKTRMKNVAGEDKALIESYESFYKEFLHKEDRFYQCLFDKSNCWAGMHLDWRKIFVVKGIGDEIWLLYDLVEGGTTEIVTVTARLIHCAMELVQNFITCNASEKPSNPNYDPDRELDQRHDAMQLPIKVYIDLIGDAYEISKLRADYVSENMGIYLGAANGVKKDLDRVELANRLNAGQLELAGRRVRVSYRTDYIGHEVDRFFRTTKAAIPGIVTIGETLFKRLNFHSEMTAYPGLFKGYFEYQTDYPNEVNPKKKKEVLYVQSDLPASELKGIGYSYRNYHLTTRQDLSAIHHMNENRNEFMQPTFKKFPSNILTQLKTSRVLMEEAEDSNGSQDPNVPSEFK
jgi:hypothetical protein